MWAFVCNVQKPLDSLWQRWSAMHPFSLQVWCGENWEAVSYHMHRKPTSPSFWPPGIQPMSGRWTCQGRDFSDVGLGRYVQLVLLLSAFAPPPAFDISAPTVTSRSEHKHWNTLCIILQGGHIHIRNFHLPKLTFLNTSTMASNMESFTPISVPLHPGGVPVDPKCLPF